MNVRPITWKRIENMRIGNAAGTVKTLEEAELACTSAAITHVTIGSIKLGKYEGNVGTTYFYNPNTGDSANAAGLSNRGLPWYLVNMREFSNIVHKSGKCLVVSLAGSSPDEYALLAQETHRVGGVDEIQLNLGCGNVWTAYGEHEPIASYNPSAVRAILQAITRAVGSSIRISVKISPVPDSILYELTCVIRDFPNVKRLVGVNTNPNWRVTMGGIPVLKFRAADAPEDAPWQEVGGIGGVQLKPHMLRVVSSLSEQCPDLEITGVGGIFSGQDLYETLERGADGFEIATAWLEHGGPKAINAILEEFSELIGDIE